MKFFLGVIVFGLLLYGAGWLVFVNSDIFGWPEGARISYALIMIILFIVGCACDDNEVDFDY